jgi:hypothetical protein
VRMPCNQTSTFILEHALFSVDIGSGIENSIRYSYLANPAI